MRTTRREQVGAVAPGVAATTLKREGVESEDFCYLWVSSPEMRGKFSAMALLEYTCRVAHSANRLIQHCYILSLKSKEIKNLSSPNVGEADLVSKINTFHQIIVKIKS